MAYLILFCAAFDHRGTIQRVTEYAMDAGESTVDPDEIRQISSTKPMLGGIPTAASLPYTS